MSLKACQYRLLLPDYGKIAAGFPPVPSACPLCHLREWGSE
jgi:hypothetical protein